MHPRAIAKRDQQKTYFADRPCKRGHMVARYTQSGKCVECDRTIGRAYVAKWRRENPERQKALCRAFYERDPSYSIRNRRKRWASVYARRKADPNKRLSAQLRAAICGQLKGRGASKSARTESLLGCSILDFRQHIERQWAPGMSWPNWGRGKGCWHLDHKRPIASFDLTDPAQQLECFNFKNYQPLWAEENARKGARWDA